MIAALAVYGIGCVIASVIAWTWCKAAANGDRGEAGL